MCKMMYATETKKNHWVFYIESMKGVNLDRFHYRVSQVFSHNPDTLVLNLEQLKTLDHKGLQALIKCLKESLEKGCKLYLSALNQGPRMILEITRTLQLFHIQEAV